MPSYLMFENGMGLEVKEDLATIRNQAGRSKDGFAELEADGKQVIVRIDAIKYAKATTEGEGGIAF